MSDKLKPVSVGNRIKHRQGFVLRYTVAGFTPETILNLYNEWTKDPACHVSLYTIKQDQHAVLTETSVEFEKNREHYRALILEQYKLVLRTLYPAVMNGNLGAIDRWMKALDHMGVITGANAPIKIEMKDTTPILSEDDRLSQIQQFLETARQRATFAMEQASGDTIDQDDRALTVINE